VKGYKPRMNLVQDEDCRFPQHFKQVGQVR